MRFFRKKVGFLIIGAQKSGTTAAFDYLKKNTFLNPSKEKEVHFFNSELDCKHDINYYHTFFDLKKTGILFEGSAGYLVNEFAHEKIFKYNSKIKMLALLRNPIDRAYSCWNMYRTYYTSNHEWFKNWMLKVAPVKYLQYKKRELKLINSFYDYVIEEINAINNGDLIEGSILVHGYYAQQLKKYYTCFSREQILLIESSEFKQNTKKCLNSIEDFLNIPRHNWDMETLSPIFTGSYKNGLDERSRKYLLNYYNPYNEELYLLLNKKFNWT